MACSTRQPSGRTTGYSTSAAAPARPPASPAATPPKGHATGIDLSEPMLDMARLRAAKENLPNVTFMPGDAQTHHFPAAAFTVAISRAGVMFFADPVAAFANIGRALEPGGRLAFVCHGNTTANPVFEALRDAGVTLDLAADTPGVPGFTDPGHVRRILTEAGFRSTAAIAFEVHSTITATAADAAKFLLDGNLRALVQKADDDTLNRTRAALETALRPFAATGAVTLPAAGWLHTATWIG
ncbi:class I SAM-dependent methyltransferase [Amycolatopsis taiwanensis]|uniref:class I SAM-dependent methyltransferase n=1 Tax=Amycolatopsis taiwanensis TaxID=342230 RepID=UPI0032D9F9ED